MGKDRNGKYHPPKGKPSGAGKNEGGLGARATEPEKMDEYLDITNKYTVDDDTLAPHVPMRHPNRNTEKGQERFRNQEDRQDTISNEEQMIREDRTSTMPEELPGVLDKTIFTELADFHADHCISIYLNTHKAGVEVNEQFDPIIFKNALQDIAAKLKAKGVNQAGIEVMLEPGYDMLRNAPFWQNLTQGLAVFIADGFFKFVKMPISVKDETIIEDTFYVTPLIPLMTNTEYFYVLVISKKRVKLFRADSYGMQYINVPGLPNGVEDTIPDDRDDETTFRIGGVGGGGAAAYHGHGGGNHLDDKTYIANFFETADDVIWKEVLHTENVPLLLAGVEYLIPVYKSVADYKHVWEDALTGSHEHEDVATLYPQVMEKMKPYFQQKIQKALESYGNKSGGALTSSIVSDVIPATYYGQVSHLFVQKNQHVWGTFDEMANELKVTDTQEEGTQDLIDNAVLRTLLTGGEVFLLEKEQMPADSAIAAIMRY